MNPRGPEAHHVSGAVAFEALMAEVMTTAERFGHREHVHLTWLAVRHYGRSTAIDLVSDGIQRTAVNRLALQQLLFGIAARAACAALLAGALALQTQPAGAWLGL